ncbi:sensor histidine kinase [Amycolatopsis albispora]|uniref:histidine kinase n=1 Tax=Amycolatopsis albispora TaxID=1804986 RepID=A0A344LE53_9PSEU|nr:sensor histidine kinase [Amycolatopsis albispora]AXB46327.1 two-component sensor histidine kinase [Amycolatopsis albispora]
MPTVDQSAAKVTAFLRWLGAPGIVLLAAVLADTAIIVDAAFDEIGPRYDDLAILPGLLLMAGCAVWARTQPVAAAFTGAVVLVCSSLVLNLAHVPTYSTVLENLSLAETVAGVELVIYVVRAARPGVAFAGTFSLVVACVLAIAARANTDSLTTLAYGRNGIFGAGLLFAAVLFGIGARSPAQQQRKSKLGELVSGQWPMVGLLSLLLFIELGEAVSVGPRAAPTLLCSLAAAGVALVAKRRPVAAAWVMAALLLLSAAATRLLLRDFSSYVLAGGVPIGQVGAGAVMVVLLIRHTTNTRAWPSILALSVAVALSAMANVRRDGPTLDFDDLQPHILSAFLVLGLSVATGLFLRSRDSERKQVVQSAVTDAQTAERMALARELHDVVAHHVTGIVVQAQAAKVVAQKDPQVAVDAMDRIETAGTEALAAMRRLVRSMRGDNPAGTTEFSEQATMSLAADLHRMVEKANHGVYTKIELNLPDDLPQEVARSALRLVQESLTNIGKHAAGATIAWVSVREENGELHIRVSDNGRGESQRTTPIPGGYGLVGMRERVALLHGRLSAGPAPEGGWLVEAWLPLAAQQGAE